MHCSSAIWKYRYGMYLTTITHDHTQRVPQVKSNNIRLTTWYHLSHDVQVRGWHKIWAVGGTGRGYTGVFVVDWSSSSPRLALLKVWKTITIAKLEIDQHTVSLQLVWRHITSEWNCQLQDSSSTITANRLIHNCTGSFSTSSVQNIPP